MIEYLLKNGVIIDNCDNKGDTPLHWACFYNQKKSVKKLLNKGANLQAKNLIEASPLHSATFSGNMNKYWFKFV